MRPPDLPATVPAAKACMKATDEEAKGALEAHTAVQEVVCLWAVDGITPEHRTLL